MINFFRHIRHKLISNNKFSKYLFYALGEIVLVVIGILIALQINNWNEERKNFALGKYYLKNIKSDLERDIIQVDRILKEHINTISIINNIDSTILKKKFHEPEKYKHFFTKIDTNTIEYIFYRGYSFRPSNDAYNSLISDGKSDLIKNKKLFQKVQEIFSELNPRLDSNYENIKRIEEKIHWNYPREKKFWSYNDLKNAKNEKIFLDLSNFAEQRYFYAMNLSLLKDKMEDLIEQIEVEIDKV